MNYREIRKSYISYFESKAHKEIKSSAVIPHNDPTLLFTNAGMNQFKDFLLGTKNSDYKRAVSVQKCIRAGGKHNDLDSVGRDGRHLTFFEMLGNWSFGDYYKKEAIEFAWEYVTGVLKLDSERIYASVYKDDDEAFGFWKNRIGLPEKKIVRLGDISKGDEENFWSMGPTGPCGPCTELYYDLGDSFGCGKPTCYVGCDCDRYLEFWNLVFMEFNRDSDGKFSPLKFKSVDTGMGFERIVAILNNKVSVFDTEIYAPYREFIFKESGLKDINQDILTSCNVLSDHVRALTFSIADGGYFSNTGRGYVMRRILRRAILHIQNIGFKGDFLNRLVPVVVSTLSDIYPEIREREIFIAKEIKTEEDKFLSTINNGLELFGETVEFLKKQGIKVFPGDKAFKLHDTYGFPIDLTQIMLEKHNMTLDHLSFSKEMEGQKEKARSSMKFYLKSDAELEFIQLSAENEHSRFVGYLENTKETEIISFAQKDENYCLLLRETPFYAESGGQVGDVGKITGTDFIFTVTDCLKGKNNEIIHICGLQSGQFSASSNLRVTAEIDIINREKIKANHTATHILHASLHNHLGKNVFQAGSRVDSESLRFDYRFSEKVEESLLSKIEEEVNEQIRKNLVVKTEEGVSYQKAIEKGVVALFGEKYGDKVRIVEIGNYSGELCGGTHTSRTGDIGALKIVSEGSISSGVRRIEAFTGKKALDNYKNNEAILKKITAFLSVPPENLIKKLEELQLNNKKLEKELYQFKKGNFKIQLEKELASARVVAGKILYITMTDCETREEFLERGDFVRDKMMTGIGILGWTNEKNVQLLVTVSGDLLNSPFNAANLIKGITKKFGGKGGGKPQLSQGSIPNVESFELIENFLVTEVLK